MNRNNALGTITQLIIDYSLYVAIALAVFTLVFAVYTVVCARHRQVGVAIIFGIASLLSAVASSSYLVQPTHPWLSLAMALVDIVLLIVMADQLAKRDLQKNYI